MITKTSIKHPAFVAKVRSAMFKAAACAQEANGLPILTSTAYVAPAAKHGNYSLRVSYHTDLCVFRVYSAGRSSLNVLPELIQAMGARQYLYAQRLADCLAQPGVEKVW